MQRQLPMQVRFASVQPATLNDETRTVDMIWSTGAQVSRMDFWTGQRYIEELSLDDGSVDLGRLNSGAPLLNSHDAGTLSDVIGVVERAWIENGVGRATVRFSERDDVAPIWNDVKSGIIRNVSVGYNVRKYQVTEQDSGTPIYRAIDWEPMELSMVPIGADAAAGVRSASTSPCEFLTADPANSRKENPMDQSVQDTAVDNAAEIRKAEQKALEAERARGVEIRAIVRSAKLTDDLADKFIVEGVAIDEVRKAVLTKLAEKSESEEVRSSSITTLRDETETRREAVENALLHRYNPKNALREDAREYRGMSLLEIAKDTLTRNGINVRGMDKTEVTTRAFHSTSDFPSILANVANKTLRAAYEAAPRTFMPICRAGTASDFKPMQRTQLGDAPSLTKVGENGSITYGTVGEAKETYAIATYAKIMGLTRQTIINDDLSAFTRLPEMFGRAAADLESDTVWGIITANAAMGDGVALFHANHGNLAAASAISVTSLGEMRALMRKQTGLGGRFINVQPRYIVVPAALETIAQQFTTQTNIVYTKSSDFNPFANALQVIAEPRLDAVSASQWYGAADPSQIDTIEYAHLEGQDGVYIETRQGFEVDGMEIKARLDFGAKAIDWRGLFRNG